MSQMMGARKADIELPFFRDDFVKFRKAFIWIAIGAFGLWLGFPNDFLQIPPAIFLWPVAMCACGLSANSFSSAFSMGWLCSFSGSATVLYWLCLPVHQVGGLPLYLAIPCALLICACISCQGGLFSFFINKIKIAPGWIIAISAGLFWFILECLFAKIIGFPWLAICAALSPWPVLIQTASLYGSYFLGGVWIAAFLLLLLPVILNENLRRRFFTGVSGIFIMAALCAYGFINLGSEEEQSQTQKIWAVFIEGNIDQNQKWNPAFQLFTLEHYERLTTEALAAAQNSEIKPDLVIWPETAMPFFLETSEILTKKLQKFIKESGVPTLFGAPGLETRPDLPAGSVFNRAWLVDGNGRILGYYDKEHLVPFGEYLPEWLNFKFLEALLQGVGIYQEGMATAPLKLGRIDLGVLICYEAIFPWLARDRAADGANILLDISNDGWFGRTPASRQHLCLTILRCIEQNRWLMRATNTGISAVFDNKGRAVLLGSQFRSGYLIGQARLEFTHTLYYYIYPWLLPASICILIALLGTYGLFKFRVSRDGRTGY